MSGFYGNCNPVIRTHRDNKYIFLFRNDREANEWMERHKVAKCTKEKLDNDFIRVTIEVGDWEESIEW